MMIHLAIEDEFAMILFY